MYREGDDMPEPRDIAAELRLLRLEEEVALLKREHFLPNNGSHRGCAPHAPPQPSLDTDRAHTHSPDRGAGSGSMYDYGRSDTAEFQPHDALYELRHIVPHLSPGFSCSERDAALLGSAIRSGAAAGGAESWDERFAALEAGRRVLQGKLDRRTQECEDLRKSVEEMKERVRATRQEAHASASVLSQRREEVRKQLLSEESRTQKLQVRNKQLEIELERLKGMLHNQMRK